MNKLLATLVAGTFAVVASSAIAQAPATGMAKEAAKDPKGSATAYQNPAAEERQAQKSQSAAKEAAATKNDPKVRPKYDEKSQQQISDSSGTNPAQQKADVAASKKMSPTREKMPDLSKLTKEQKQELYRQLQKEATGG